MGKDSQENTYTPTSLSTAFTHWRQRKVSKQDLTAFWSGSVEDQPIQEEGGGAAALRLRRSCTLAITIPTRTEWRSAYYKGWEKTVDPEEQAVDVFSEHESRANTTHQPLTVYRVICFVKCSKLHFIFPVNVLVQLACWHSLGQNSWFWLPCSTAPGSSDCLLKCWVPTPGHSERATVGLQSSRVAWPLTFCAS